MKFCSLVIISFLISPIAKAHTLERSINYYSASLQLPNILFDIGEATAPLDFSAVTETVVEPEFPTAIVDNAEIVQAISLAHNVATFGPLEFKMSVERGLGEWIKHTDSYTHFAFSCELKTN